MVDVVVDVSCLAAHTVNAKVNFTGNLAVHALSRSPVLVLLRPRGHIQRGCWWKALVSNMVGMDVCKSSVFC